MYIYIYIILSGGKFMVVYIENYPHFCIIIIIYAYYDTTHFLVLKNVYIYFIIFYLYLLLNINFRFYDSPCTFLYIWFHNFLENFLLCYFEINDNQTNQWSFKRKLFFHLFIKLRNRKCFCYRFIYYKKS